jgi:hypothetical protein
MWMVASAVTVLLGIGTLAATASTTSRHALIAQLERGAVPPRATATQGFRVTRTSSGPRSFVVLALGPNRASVANNLHIRLTDHGRPVSGARVRVSFSMPSMGMWNAYTAVLAPAGIGRYAATVPVLGMAGRWQLRIDVAVSPDGTSRVTVTDRLGS